MHITLESDYALRIVYFLLEYGKRADAALVSRETGVTLRFALKILRKLVAAGLVKSFKGAMGGYEMAKTPEETSMGDVIEAIEGVYRLSRCLNPQVGCSRQQENFCPIHKAFGRISDSVREMLERETFDKLLAEKDSCCEK